MFSLRKPEAFATVVFSGRQGNKSHATRDPACYHPHRGERRVSELEVSELLDAHPSSHRGRRQLHDLPRLLADDVRARDEPGRPGDYELARALGASVYACPRSRSAWGTTATAQSCSHRDSFSVRPTLPYSGSVKTPWGTTAGRKVRSPSRTAFSAEIFASCETLVLNVSSTRT